MKIVKPESGTKPIYKTAVEIMREALPEAIKQLRQQIDDDMYALAKEANKRKAMQ